MTDHPTCWPETPDIVLRLRARREAWTCIREEAASEIEVLRKANLRLLGEVGRLTDRLSVYVDKASLHDQARESETFWFRRARELESKLATITTTLKHYAASDGRLAPLAAAVLREIEETK